MIALTITTCRRLKLFEMTINSFINSCQDISLIDYIIHYDDSSLEEDRIKMQNIIKELLPDVSIFKMYFEPNDITSKKRHLEIMKIWKSQIMMFDYVIHLEDDWLFIDKFQIKEGIDILKSNIDIAMIGYSWQMKEFPKDLFIPKQIGNYWEWFYSDKYELNESLFMDEVEMKHLPPGHWVKCINWPYFGLRPALHDVKKLNQLDNFNDNMNSFELEFAIRFSKMFKSFLHKNRICYHIGAGESAYNINNSNR